MRFLTNTFRDPSQLVNTNLNINLILPKMVIFYLTGTIFHQVPVIINPLILRRLILKAKKSLYKKKTDWFHDKQLICPDMNVWSGDRYTTKQRKPYVGKMLKQVNNQIEFKWYDNVYINTFYGSKGFSFTPHLSELLIDLMLNQTKNENVTFLNYLNPYQNNIKVLNKSKLKDFYYV